ncbi:hypothetical protein IFM89_033419 [Coptis chinensis]|uniref:Uncharacterized protein n=1 Tax=Coptis chinensis TaxID=261450 RepID=A0A835HZZ2_9MAGN|nr:hypothetical protein IFM89_033419 [Coptis chinensis]
MEEKKQGSGMLENPNQEVHEVVMIPEIAGVDTESLPKAATAVTEVNTETAPTAHTRKLMVSINPSSIFCPPNESSIVLHNNFTLLEEELPIEETQNQVTKESETIETRWSDMVEVEATAITPFASGTTIGAKRGRKKKNDPSKVTMSGPPTVQTRALALMQTHPPPTPNSSDNDLLLTFVHASCFIGGRRQLWSEIELLQHSGPRMVVGDFNCVLSYQEKKGGLRPNRLAMEEFFNALNSCNLLEAQHSGMEFSWCNNQRGVRRMVAKLDRILINDFWERSFIGWKYKTLSRVSSDHSPLCGELSYIPKPENTPFHFNIFWASHPSFVDLVKHSWNQDTNGLPMIKLMRKLQQLKQDLKIWNRNVFGVVEMNIKKA